MQFMVLLSLAAACAASPIESSGALRPFVKPKSTDSRSPCPMLNTLANHGYIPHDGLNITAQQFGDAIFASTNWAKDFGILPAEAALQRLNQISVDLSDLNSVPGGEHPGSLTRDDASSGDSNNVNPSRVSQLLADSSKSNFLTVDSVAKTRNRLDKTCKPPLTDSELGIAQGEAALMMLLMREHYGNEAQDLSNLRAPKERTAVWLLEEKFPTQQGWKPAPTVVQLADLAPVNEAIVASQAKQN